MDDCCIGRKLSRKLTDQGIETALQLRDADISSIRARCGVVMEKTIRELRGEACLELAEVEPSKNRLFPAVPSARP